MTYDFCQVLRFMYPSLDALMLAGRVIVTTEIVRWDATLGTQPTLAEIEAQELSAVRHYKVADIRTEARTRIETKYPEWRQRSAALGVYPIEYVAQMQADIAAVIAASNTAEDAVAAATTVAEVEAVTATWPVI